MRFADAKISVARVAGDQGDIDQREIAGDAVKAAIRDWNTEHNWEFKFREDPSLAVVADQQDVEIEGLKKVHTIRVNGGQGTLQYSRMRQIDYTIREHSRSGVPLIYTVIESSTQNVIRLYPIPETAIELYVRYYEEIEEPSDDEDELDIPGRFLNALLARAKYHYLLNKDTENLRLDKYETLSTVLLRKAIRDDKKQPDEIEMFHSRADYGQAFGRTFEDEF